MAWTTPRTWATNEVVTSANMNTHVRDNIAFLGDPPICSVSNTTTQSIGTGGTAAVMPANTESRDNNAMHSTVTNTSRITINTAGTYLFVARVRFQANVTGDRSIGLKIDGGTEVNGSSTPACTSGIDTILANTFVLPLNATQFVETIAYQTSGGNLNATLLEFSAVLLTVA